MMVDDNGFAIVISFCHHLSGFVLSKYAQWHRFQINVQVIQRLLAATLKLSDFLGFTGIA